MAESGVDGLAGGRRKDPPVEHPLKCTLEELYKGTVKKLKINRNVLDGSSMKSMNIEETLVVDIKPGWKKGTKVTFAEKGEYAAPCKPCGCHSALLFLIVCRAHLPQLSKLPFRPFLQLMEESFCWGTLRSHILACGSGNVNVLAEG